MSDNSKTAGKDPKPAAHASFREVSTPVTVACVGLASCSAVFAGFATFKTDNELGTAGAFLVGLFFAVVALSGRVPRIKFGDNEIDPGVAYAAGARDGADAVADAAEAAAVDAKSPEEVAVRTRQVEEDLAAAFLRNDGTVSRFTYGGKVVYSPRQNKPWREAGDWDDAERDASATDPADPN